MSDQVRQSPFDPEQHRLETDLRSRSARRARGLMRRMEPIVMRTPRWSSPQAFLEDLALEMALEKTPVRCRTLSLEPMRSRERHETWTWLLEALAQLGPNGPLETTYVASPVGFRRAVVELLQRLQSELTHETALLVHHAETLAPGVSSALIEAWVQYAHLVPTNRMVNLLLCGALGETSGEKIHSLTLNDYSSHEATRAMSSMLDANSPDGLNAAVAFSGGIPAVIDTMAQNIRRIGGIPLSTSGLMKCLGDLQPDLQEAMQLISDRPELAQRVDALVAADLLPLIPELDQALITAGLVSCVGRNQVSIRAPLFLSMAS